MLVCQGFCYGIFSIVKDTDVDPVLVLLLITRAAEADWDARSHLDWFSHTFGEGTISVLPSAACSRLVSTSGKLIKESGVHVRRSEYNKDITTCGMLEA